MPIRQEPRWSPFCSTMKRLPCCAINMVTNRPSTRLRPGFMTAWQPHTKAARLAITGGNPALLSKENPEHVSRANRSMSKAYRPALELITRHDINWTIVSAATPAWATAVFPGLPENEAVAKLWDAIFAASRADQPDPVAAWKKHDDGLHA